MTLKQLATRLSKYVGDNSPAILTGIAVTGVVTTMILTGRATLKAAEIIDQIESKEGTAETARKRFQERSKVVWKLYIPAVVTGGLTVAAIVGANRIGTRRTAAIAAAYSITERAFENYRDKIVEKIGPKKEQAARDEIAQEHISANPLGGKALIIAKGDVLCYEAFTGRYFMSDIEELRRAQNDINERILADGYASMSDFYDLIGLPHTTGSDLFGWVVHRGVDLRFSAVLGENNVPCISFDYKHAPTRDYHYFA